MGTRSVFSKARCIMGSQKNVFIICVVLATSITAVCGFGFEKILGKGLWSVLNVKNCDNDDQYQYHFTVNRRKVSRTQDGFSGKIDTGDDIDDTFAIRLDICKWLDGGCKPFQVMMDDCFCCFAKKHGGENLHRILESAGLDPADCPIPKGHYEIENFVFNYEDLPADGVYGKFDVNVLLKKDEVDMACLKITVEFTEAGHD